MNALVIASIGLHFVFGQQSIGDVQVEDMAPRVANISKTTDVIITTKDDAERRSGTIYLYDASKLVLNTAWLQKRDYITIGVATGIFTGVGFLLALGSHSLTKKFKVLDEINYRDIQQIQIKKTNNRNAIIASSLLFLGLVSQAGHPKWGPVLGFIGIPLSLTPFLLKPYFSYSWETIYNANEGGQDDPMPPQT